MDIVINILASSNCLTDYKLNPKVEDFLPFQIIEALSEELNQGASEKIVTSDQSY